jgi:hypothetical protein
MLFKKALLPMLILASLAGCGPAVLDGTTPDALEASIAKVANKLPSEQRPQFGADLELVKSYYTKQSPDQLLFNLNGKNAAEIATEANNLREQLKLEEEKLAVEEMKKAYLVELGTKKASLLEAIKPLEESKNQSLDRAKFEVVKANIALAKKETSGEHVNTIALTVTNGTSQEIYGAFFKGTLTVAGEEAPRVSSVIDVDFENGLQPGETRSLVFVPTLASEWRTAEIPASSTFILVTDELLNIANKPLFSSAQFSADDQTSLDSLNAELDAVNRELGVADGDTPKTAEVSAEQPPVVTPEPQVESSLPPSLLPEASDDTPLAPTDEPAVEAADLPSDVQAEPEIRDPQPPEEEIPAAVAPAPAPTPEVEAVPAPSPEVAPTPEVAQEVAPAAEPAPVIAPPVANDLAPAAPAEDVKVPAEAPVPTVKIEDVSPNSASTPKRVQAKHA